jgi:phosphoglycerate dehydrogenase-like enzyme
LQVDEVGLEQVPDVIHNYHICVVKNRRIDSDIIAKATQMKIIMQYGVGLEGDSNSDAILSIQSICQFNWPYYINCIFSTGVDVNAATEHKIKVARIPGSTTGNAVSCAEMAIYLALGVLRKQVCVVCLVVLTMWKLEVLVTFQLDRFHIHKQL